MLGGDAAVPCARGHAGVSDSGRSGARTSASRCHLFFTPPPPPPFGLKYRLTEDPHPAPPPRPQAVITAPTASPQLPASFACCRPYVDSWPRSRGGRDTPALARPAPPSCRASVSSARPRPWSARGCCTVASRSFTDRPCGPVAGSACDLPARPRQASDVTRCSIHRGHPPDLASRSRCSGASMCLTPCR